MKEVEVRYELMHGRDAMAAIARMPVGYLPIGCLERHGDHLPMGLDIIKAHGICCQAAREIGGVVFPPHFYSGIHGMNAQEIAHYTGEWGNIYTDASSERHLLDIIAQLGIAGIKVLVLYSGHYPQCQLDMIERIAEETNRQGHMRVIPISDCYVVSGDHAGVSETSIMLYLDSAEVDMARIGPENYQDHHWRETNSPEQATRERGEAEVTRVIEALRAKIHAAL